MPLLFTAISLLYALFALRTLYRLVRHWCELWDNLWTPADRELAQMVGLLLLTPPLVWLHEWGHATAFRYFGAADPQIHFFLYWGYVTAPLRLSPDQQFVVSLAGPAMTYLLGVALLAVSLLVRLPPAAALALASCAYAQLTLILIIYPGMSLLGGWGDFTAIYTAAVPTGATVVGIVQAVSLVAFLWLMQRPWLKAFMIVPRARPWELLRPPAPPAPAPGGPPAV